MQTNNEAVTGQVVSPAEEMAKLMVAQSAAMLVEDLRAFIQGSEQILLVALAKSLEKATNPASADVNTAANVASITGALGCLSDYAESITRSAGTIAGGFQRAEVAPTPDVPVRDAPTATQGTQAPPAPWRKSRGFFANLMS